MKKYIPIILIIVFMIIAYFSGLYDYLNFQFIKNNITEFNEFLLQYKILAPCIYIFIYMIITALSIPGALYLTIIGGMLFGQPWATIYVVIGASIGAVIIFTSAKTFLNDFLKKKTYKFFSKIEKEFKENNISYLFFLRLVPVFPFWVVNIVLAFLKVRVSTFFFTTLIGIIPGTYVFAQIGTGIASVITTQKSFSIKDSFTLEIKVALLALGALSLLPILLKKIWKKKDVR